jgi:hypothetical protein
LLYQQSDKLVKDDITKKESAMQIKECLYCPTNYDPSSYSYYNDIVEDQMDKFYDEAVERLLEQENGELLIAAILGQKAKFSNLLARL